MSLEESRRRQYLAAMDIPLWEPRTSHAAPTGTATAAIPADNTPAAPSSEERHRGGAPSVDPSMDWQALQDAVRTCTKCGLHKTRTQTVFGVGNPTASWMFIGEAPGADEDRQGEPFVGRAGQLLTKIIEAIGLRREDVYIANVLKCRPPENRDPTPAEIDACDVWFCRHVEALAPKVVVKIGWSVRYKDETEAMVDPLQSKLGLVEDAK